VQIGGRGTLRGGGGHGVLLVAETFVFGLLLEEVHLLVDDVGAFDEGVLGRSAPLAPGDQFATADEGLDCGLVEDVGLPLGAFGDGLETAVVAFVVAELVLNNSQQALIEFQQSFDLALVLRVQLLLLLDLLQVTVDCSLEIRVFLPKALHPSKKSIYSHRVGFDIPHPE
jgi:hypothetical protein